jgi:hypothetical protein
MYVRLTGSCEKGAGCWGADRALARRSMYGTLHHRGCRACPMEMYPKFHNELGVLIAPIGHREFECIVQIFSVGQRIGGRHEKKADIFTDVHNCDRNVPHRLDAIHRR